LLVNPHNSLEGALSYCNNPESLSRTHFARWLTDQGHAKPGKAFDKYLAQGKAGYTNQTWASLEDAMSWILGSGGVAVIAHPCRYKFTRTKLLKLINNFKSLGGVGIEVISSSHSKDDVEQISGIALASNLLASSGSDFHTIETFRTIKVGVCYPLPLRSKPIFPLLGINI
jgi:3',5'-nucleoside bisphosphate phosphatase